ncbi:hypothetical protein WCP94_001114 [Bilophila wadsworthia]
MGRHPGCGHGNQAYATRRLSAKINPAPTCFYSIQKNKVSFFKKTR